jgi:hypothetical protein
MSRFVERPWRPIQKRNRKTVKPAARARLALERPEDRLTPTPTLTIGPTVPELIGALTDANKIPGGGVIKLAPGATYDLTAVDNYWYGPNGLPAITSVVTIEGDGAISQRDPSGPDFRLFYVSGGLTGELRPGALTLNNLTLEGGVARGGDGGAGGGGGMGAGGAIFNQGVVPAGAWPADRRRPSGRAPSPCPSIAPSPLASTLPQSAVGRRPFRPD